MKQMWGLLTIRGSTLCEVAEHLPHVQRPIILAVDKKVAVKFFHLVPVPCQLN